MPCYKFYYFDGRGRGELCRYVFIAAGEDFEDNRYTFDTWKDFKPSTPFGQIPVLDVDGTKIAQSGAITRYLAREFNLAGKNSLEQALCDQYIGLADDVFKEVAKSFFESDEEKLNATLKHLKEEVYPKFLAMFESSLNKSGGQGFVGEGLTVADLAVFAVFDTPMQRDSNLMDAFPKMKAHRARLEGHPKLGDYINKRKKSDI